jgi:hypothetical protein
MSNRFAFALSCAAWLAAGAVLAQPVAAPAATDAPSTRVSPVTVQPAPTPKEIQRQAERFVRSWAAAPNPGVDQIGRWRGPVCVNVWGLPLAEQAARIKARIEGMAQALGLPPAPSGCTTNVEIVFTDQPQSTMDVIARRWQPVLGYYHRSKTRQLETVTHPIQAWYMTATASEGVDVAAVLFSGVPRALIPPSTHVVDDPTNTSPAGCLDRFTSCYQSAFHNVLIVADSKALAGETLRVIADDMVMLALSQPRSLDTCYALPSVIDRFAKPACDGRDPPSGLTPADTAYLTALYAADLGAKKRFELSDVAERMAAILIKADAAPAAGAGRAGSAPSPR